MMDDLQESAARRWAEKLIERRLCDYVAVAEYLGRLSEMFAQPTGRIYIYRKEGT